MILLWRITPRVVVTVAFGPCDLFLAVERDYPIVWVRLSLMLVEVEVGVIKW